MEMFLDKQVRATSPLMKYVYENFEKNLRDTIEAAHASGRASHRQHSGDESERLRAVWIAAPRKSASG